MESAGLSARDQTKLLLRGDQVQDTANDPRRIATSLTWALNGRVVRARVHDLETFRWRMSATDRSEHRRGPAELLVVVLPRAGSAVGALVDPALVAGLVSQHRARTAIWHPIGWSWSQSRYSRSCRVGRWTFANWAG